MNEKLENGGTFGLGEKNPFGQFFVGQSYLKLLSSEQVGICNVTFEPGCLNNWHGAAKDSWFIHIAIEVPGEDSSNEWQEPEHDIGFVAFSPMASGFLAGKVTTETEYID